MTKSLRELKASEEWELKWEKATEEELLSWRKRMQTGDGTKSLAEERIPHKIRAAKLEDRPFITGTYRTSLGLGGDFDWTKKELQVSTGPFYSTGTPWYCAEVNRRIDIFLPNCAVVEGEIGLLGWAASFDDWMHYAYVKQPYRRMGLAKELWEWFDKPPTATHWTRGAMMARADRGLIYHPTYWREYT